MIFRRTPLVLMLIAILPLRAADDRAPEALVTLLGDESYPTREQASRDLWKMGREAEKMLLKAADSPDPEVASRARDVLRKIQLGILPDSPPEVVKLVVGYDRATPDERQRIIRRLKSYRAWRQMLKIYELENDPEVLQRIAPEMVGVSVEAAREVLVIEPPDFKAAREFLEMGRAEPRDLMALADFHRARGTLEQELGRARDLEGRAGHLWRYALQAAAGRLGEAADEAAAADEPLIAARLRLLDGDPLPWIKRAPMSFGQMVPESLDGYRKAAALRWEGEPVPEKLTDGLAKQVRQDEDGEGWGPMGMLCALGEYEATESLHAKLSPISAFATLMSVERVDEGLALMGLDLEAPDFKAWTAKRFRVLIDDPDSLENEISELKIMGAFLEGRGMNDLLDECYVEPLNELARTDPETFINVVKDLYSRDFSPLVGPVLETCIDFAGDDPVRWATVRDALFNDRAYFDLIWKGIAKSGPDLSEADRLRTMAVLLGHLPDSSGAGRDWWEAAWTMAGDGAKADRVSMLEVLLALSILNSDADKFLKASEVLSELEVELEGLELADHLSLASVRILALRVAGRWDEVADHFRPLATKIPTLLAIRANLAAALSRSGDEEGADLHEESLELLVLGDALAMMDLGKVYANAGLAERAREWWLRGAVAAASDDGGFQINAYLLRSIVMERGEWKLAAALGEAELLRLLMDDNSADNLTDLKNERMKTDLARAMSIIETRRPAALEILERSHRAGPTEPSLADFYFPALREAGLNELHDRWFDGAWRTYQASLERFPGSDNSMNTAAWTAARANRRLGEAETLVKRALELRPGQAAYLDTMGEVCFARRDREGAVDWSGQALNRAVTSSILDSLMSQYERFRSGDFPVE